MAARSAALTPVRRATGSDSQSTSADGWDEGLLWGIALITFGCVSLAFFLCALRPASASAEAYQLRLRCSTVHARYRLSRALPIVSPRSSPQLLDAIKHDDHYVLLLPLLWPVSLIFVIVNWGTPPPRGID